MSLADGEEAFRRAHLLLILRANAALLLELRAWKPADSEGGTLTSTKGVEELLVAAPRLRLLECDAFLSGESACGPLPLLVCEPQFAPLRVQTLYIDAENGSILAARFCRTPRQHSGMAFSRIEDL
jgi:hypothetical protein